MKLRLSLLPVILFAVGLTSSCEKNDIPTQQENTLILTIASKLTPYDFMYPDPWQDYIVKLQNSNTWMVFPYAIDRFYYQPGTEYIVQIEKEIYPDPTFKTSVVHFRLKKIISEHKKDSEGIDKISHEAIKLSNPTKEGWISMNVASRTDKNGNLLVQYAGKDEWESFENKIEGWEYIPGYEYQLLVEQRRVGFPIQNASTIRFFWMETVSKEQKDSEGIDNL